MRAEPLDAQALPHRTNPPCLGGRLAYIRSEFGTEAALGLETRVKPISYLKAHSAEVIRELSEGAAPLVITQNGEAKAVIQDVASYAATQDLLALLKLLALARDDMADRRVQPLEGLKDRIRSRAGR